MKEIKDMVGKTFDFGFEPVYVTVQADDTLALPSYKICGTEQCVIEWLGNNSAGILSEPPEGFTITVEWMGAQYSGDCRKAAAVMNFIRASQQKLAPGVIRFALSPDERFIHAWTSDGPIWTYQTRGVAPEGLFQFFRLMLPVIGVSRNVFGHMLEEPRLDPEYLGIGAGITLDTYECFSLMVMSNGIRFPLVHTKDHFIGPVRTLLANVLTGTTWRLEKDGSLVDTRYDVPPSVCSEWQEHILEVDRTRNVRIACTQPVYDWLVYNLRLSQYERPNTASACITLWDETRFVGDIGDILAILRELNDFNQRPKHAGEVQFVHQPRENMVIAVDVHGNILSSVYRDCHVAAAIRPAMAIILPQIGVFRQYRQMVPDVSMDFEIGRGTLRFVYDHVSGHIEAFVSGQPVWTHVWTHVLTDAMPDVFVPFVRANASHMKLVETKPGWFRYEPKQA